MLKFNQNPIVSLCSQNLNTVRGHHNCGSSWNQQRPQPYLMVYGKRFAYLIKYNQYTACV